MESNISIEIDRKTAEIVAGVLQRVSLQHGCYLTLDPETHKGEIEALLKLKDKLQAKF